MDIKVNKGENLSLVIKKTLINEGANEKSFTASVWNKILDLVDKQNEEDKNNNKKGLYQGGSVRIPANWKKNYKVFVGQILNFSETTWNSIRNLVGLGTIEDTNQSQETLPKIDVAPLLPELELKTKALPMPDIKGVIQENGIAQETTDTKNNGVKDSKTSSDLEVTYRGKEPDVMSSQLNPEKEVAAIPALEPILDAQQTKLNTSNPEIKQNESVIQSEQTNVQEKKDKKVKTKKGQKHEVITNSDGSTTEIQVKRNKDGSTVKTETTKRPIENTSWMNVETIIITTSADGRTETIETIVDNESTLDKRSRRVKETKSTITHEANGNKTVTFEKVQQGIFTQADEVKCTYSMDNSGNILAKLADGSTLSINFNTLIQSDSDKQETEIKMTDKNGSEIIIPLKINQNCYSGTDKLRKLSKEEQVTVIIANLSSAISGLSADALNAFKTKIKELTLEPQLGNLKTAGEQSGGVIKLNTNDGLSSKILTHEIGHAVDFNNDIEKHQTSEYYEKINNLINLIKDKNINKKAYALSNPRDLFAEYYSVKEGYGLNDTKDMLQQLENTQDSELKKAYQEVKAIFDKIIEDSKAG